MKVTRVDTIPLKIPLTKPMLMGGVRYETAETVLVRAETDGRVVGWGEAAVAPGLTGETSASIMAIVPMLAEQIAGLDPRDLGAASRCLRRAVYGNTAAKAALDMALHDIVGRSIGWSITRLLGGARTESLDCLCLVGNSDPDRDIMEAERKAGEGFCCFKLKVANGDLDAEVETLVTMRKRLGGKMLLCADANTNWTTEEAIRFVQAVEGCAPSFVEQPVSGDDLRGLRRVAAASRVPVGADEGLHDMNGMTHMLEAGIAAGGSFKIMKFEGINHCHAAIQRCQAMGGNVNLSGKLGETSVANAATLALAGAFGAPPWGLSLTNHYLADDVVRNPIRVVSGSVRTMNLPGLGIEVNEQALAKYESWPAAPSRDRQKRELAFAPTP
jgi:L-alanine-DL-glutamate epimerase-like enolase superfamily enzyme